MSNWLDSRLRWPWLVVLALIVREAVALTPLGRVDALRYVYAIFVAVLIGWTVWHVKRLPGVWIVTIGAAANLLVILANDFRMPVAPASAAGLAGVGHTGQYVIMDSSTRLIWLGDWISVPSWLGGAYSPGDIVVALGTGVVAFFLTAQYRAAG